MVLRKTAGPEGEVHCRRITHDDAAAIASLERLMYSGDFRAGHRQLRSELAEAEWDNSSFSYGLFVGADLVGVVLAFYEPDCRRMFDYFELDRPSDISAEECLYIADFMVRREYRQYTLRLIKEMRAALGASHGMLPLYGFSTKATLEQWQQRRYAPRRAGYRYTGQRRFTVERPPYELFLVRFDPRRTFGEASSGARRGAADARETKALTVSVASTQSAWARLEGDWDALLRRTPGATALQSFSLHRIWWQHFGDDGRPLILVVHAEGAVRAIAPFWLQTQMYLGRPRRLLKFIGESGEIGRPTILRDGDDREAVAAVFSYLFDNGSLWDSMVLREQPRDGLLLSAARERCVGTRVIASVVAGPRSPRLDVRGSWQTYLAGRPQALTESLERARRQVEQAGETAFVTYDSWPEMVAAFEVYQELQAGRAEMESAASATTRAHRAFELALFYEYGPKRRLRLHTLSVAGKPIAAAVGLLERGKLSRLRAAYAPGYPRAALEQLLTAYALEDAHQRAECEQYEFLDGFDDVGALWTSAPSETQQLYVYRRDALFLIHHAWHFRMGPILKGTLRRVGLLGPLLRIGDGVRSWRAIAGGHWLRRANVKE
jgi:hypothetical protein